MPCYIQLLSCLIVSVKKRRKQKEVTVMLALNCSNLVDRVLVVENDIWKIALVDTLKRDFKVGFNMDSCPPC